MSSRTTAQPGAATWVLSPPRLVGRTTQLHALTQALIRSPAVVLIEGEAGIGKSRLVRECLSAPQLQQQRVLVGACPPYREPSTLAPIVDALRLVDRPPETLRLSPLAGALRPLFPEWADQLPPNPEPLESVTAARHRLLRALAELVGSLGTDVLVLEDAHWADETSLEFLLFLATRQRLPRPRGGDSPGPPSLVVTYRPEDITEGSLLRRLPAGLPAGTWQVRITLDPLDVADTAELASSMLGDEVMPSFAEFLHQHTDGLPLAVEESVRLLDDRDDLVHRDGGWARASDTTLAVPPTVRDSTLERVQRLEPAAQRVLQVAAVLAEPADEDTLMQVANLAEPVGLLRAVSSGLLHDAGAGRLAFRHVLSAMAVYESIPAPARRRLHLRAGETLERAQPPAAAAKLARHFREGGDPARWLRHGETAADLAVAASDHLTAVDLLEDLLAFPEFAVPDRVRLARKLGLAVLFMRAVGTERAWASVKKLREIRDDPALDQRQRAEVGTVLGRLLNQFGVHAEAFTELTRAVPHLGHRPVEAAHSMNLLGWPRAGPWSVTTHLRWLKRAEAVPLTEATPAERLSLTIDRATALLQLGYPAGWQVLDRLPSEVDSGEQRLHLARGLLNLGDCALLWGWYAEARRLLGNGLEVAEANQYARIRDCVTSNLVRLDWLTGAWDGLVGQAQSLMHDHDAMAVAREEATLITALWETAQGQHRMAEERLEGLLEQFRQQGAVLQEPAPAAALARLYLEQDDVDAAVKVTAGPMQVIETKRIWIWAGELAPIRVQALLAAGHTEEAEQLVARFAAGLRGRKAPAPRGALATCRALLIAHTRDALAGADAYGRAARIWEALPRPYDALLAREQRATCLFDAGRVDAAVSLLTRVLDGFAALGATADADRAARRLREHGVARPWRGGRRGYGDQLSPRELEVVRLVITGKTNREIAHELSKSPGTVAEQLRSAMRKLGVSSRTALAVAAVEAGVLSDRG